MNIVKLYANVESGRVAGIDGNEYRIQNGIVMVPEYCVANLVSRGFVATDVVSDSAPVEAVAEPAVRKRTKK